MKSFETVRDEFEVQRQQGNRSAIAGWLDQVPERERERLLKELIVMDIHYRQEAGDALSQEDYARQFPNLELAKVYESVRQAKQAANSMTPTVDAPQIKSGSLVAGKYRLLERLGEGGMGQVWLAEQRVPVKRQVAIKLIRPGMDSEGVLNRFEAERQALALMDHPNIAKVIDGGTTEAGRPFFVMELVRGVPLTNFCDQNRLDIPARLELFKSICSAVQHAHQKGIIHRDLKPGNILVSEQDGKPVSKVIDFGLAKALYSSHLLTDKTVHTAIGAVVGTPMYMSPEQVKSDSFDVDTRTDIYSLGVILYELITGSTPLERKRLKEAVWDEVRRLIREEDPPKPSSRLSTSDMLPSIAASRQILPAQLSRFVKGDLDWIVMKALDKDRNRRYETANGLARDVERFLADEVVEATPPSSAYRLRKFVRRNKGQVLAGCAVGLALLAGIAGTSFGLFRAEARRVEAEASKQEATEEKKKAEVLASSEQAAKEQALSVLKYFQDYVFVAAQPVGTPGGLGKDVTLRRAIDEAIPKIETAFGKTPLVEASIRNALGTTYFYLGESSLAADQYRKAVEIRTRDLGLRHPDTLQSQFDFASAIRLLPGRRQEAIELDELTLKLRREVLGEEHPDTLTSMGNLAMAYEMSGGKLDKAEQLLLQLLPISRRINGELHLLTVSSMHTLASLYANQGRILDAIELLEPLVPTNVQEIQNCSVYQLAVCNDLAGYYSVSGQSLRALELSKRAVTFAIGNLGPAHSNTIASRYMLCEILGTNRDFIDAVEEAKKLLTDVEQTFGSGSREAFVARMNLGNRYQAAGQPEQALSILESDLELLLRDKAIPPEKIDCLKIAGRAQGKTGRFELAAISLRTVVEFERKQFGELAIQRVPGLLDLVFECLLPTKRYSEAEVVVREVLKIREAKQPGTWGVNSAQSVIGETLFKQEKYDEAEPLLLAGYDGLVKTSESILAKDRSTVLGRALNRLIEFYQGRNQPEKASQYEELRAKLAGPQSK